MARAFVLVLLVCAAASARGPYDNHRIVVIDIGSQKDSFVAGQLGVSLACAPGPGPQEYLIAPENFEALKASGLRFVVTVEDAQRHVDDDYALNAQAAERGGTFFDAFRTFDQINAYLLELDTLPGRPEEQVVRFPIGQSIEGRTTYALKLTAPVDPLAPPRPTFLITAGQHAREWIGVSSGLYIMDRLVRGYGVDSTITALVDQVDFVFVPVVNPDGYTYTFPVSQGGAGFRYWRKNRRNNGSAFGVDTNRNWSVGWGGAGASSSPFSDTYRGAAPFSEAETNNIRRLVEGDEALPGLPNLKAMIDLHTFSELVLAPWGYTESPAPRMEETGPLTEAQISAINSVNGQFFTGGPSATTLYLASGTSPDWAFGQHNALAWTYELRPRDGGLSGFNLPPSHIRPAGAEAFAGILVVANHLQHRLRVQITAVTDPLPLIGGGSLSVSITELNAYTLDSSSPRLFWRIGSVGPFTETTLDPGPGASDFTASLVSPPCGETIEYYLHAQTTDGGIVLFPPGAPSSIATIAGASCPDCLGDADGNRAVDFTDISAVIANWGDVGTAGPPLNIGDSNWDGNVDFQDINAVIANWGAACP